MLLWLSYYPGSSPLVTTANQALLALLHNTVE